MRGNLFWVGLMFLSLGGCAFVNHPQARLPKGSRIFVPADELVVLHGTPIHRLPGSEEDYVETWVPGVNYEGKAPWE